MTNLMLRTYPEAFADKILELYPRITGAEGVPNPEDDRSPEVIFEELNWETWDEARLMPALKYLRGNRHLDIPEDWLKAFPVPFEILNRLGI